MKYLLPCSCGHKVPVEPRQAGQAISCRCGATIEVPTMLKLVALERAPSAAHAAPPGETWGLRQKMVLLGAIVVVIAVASAVYQYSRRPIPLTVNKEAIRRWAGDLSPSHAHRFWQGARSEGISAGMPSDTAAYQQTLFRYRLAMGALLFGAGCGVGLIVTGFLIRRGPRRGAKP